MSRRIVIDRAEEQTYAQTYPLQYTAARTPWLFGLAFDAPLIGVRKRWPKTLHAVEMEAVMDGALGPGTFVSACGAKGLRLLSHIIEGNQLAALWPPAVKNLPGERCRECWERTGRKRPRTKWVLGEKETP